MPAATIPISDPERVEALAKYAILDSAPEQEFDDVVLAAAALCDTPIALITLVDKDRQWFKARIGLNITETPRSVAFCGHTILSDDVLVVDDALEDDRFEDNPLVTGDTAIRFYAGAPILDDDGFRFGSVCAIDRRPRQINAAKVDGLTALARITSNLLKNRLWRRRLLSEFPDDFVTMCSLCRKFEDGDSFWWSIEAYLRRAHDMSISHGLCAECVSNYDSEPLSNQEQSEVGV